MYPIFHRLVLKFTSIQIRFTIPGSLCKMNKMENGTLVIDSIGLVNLMDSVSSTCSTHLIEGEMRMYNHSTLVKRK